MRVGRDFAAWVDFGIWLGGIVAGVEDHPSDEDLLLGTPVETPAYRSGVRPKSKCRSFDSLRYATVAQDDRFVGGGRPLGERALSAASPRGLISEIWGGLVSGGWKPPAPSVTSDEKQMQVPFPKSNRRSFAFATLGSG